jgi:hypothetical protein
MGALSVEGVMGVLYAEWRKTTLEELPWLMST